MKSKKAEGLRGESLRKKKVVEVHEKAMYLKGGV